MEDKKYTDGYRDYIDEHLSDDDAIVPEDYARHEDAPIIPMGSNQLKHVNNPIARLALAVIREGVYADGPTYLNTWGARFWRAVLEERVK